MQAEWKDVHVLVNFYSRGGLTERMAVLIAEGALQGGASIRLRRARDLAPDELVDTVPGWKENRDRMHAEYAEPKPADAEWADAIAFGTPASLRRLSDELAHSLDQFAGGDKANGLAGKLCSAFSSVLLAGGHGRTAEVELQTRLLELGCVVVPAPGAGFAHQDEAFEAARAHGRHLAAVARALQPLHATKPA